MGLNISELISRFYLAVGALATVPIVSAGSYAVGPSGHGRSVPVLLKLRRFAARFWEPSGVVAAFRPQSFPHRTSS